MRKTQNIAVESLEIIDDKELPRNENDKLSTLMFKRCYLVK